MSSEAKGLMGIVLSIIGLFSAVFIVDQLPNQYRGLLLINTIIPLIFSIAGIYLGIIARKGGARIWGLISIVLGIIGTLSHVLSLGGFGN